MRLSKDLGKAPHGATTIAAARWKNKRSTLQKKEEPSERWKSLFTRKSEQPKRICYETQAIQDKAREPGKEICQERKH